MAKKNQPTSLAAISSPLRLESFHVLNFACVSKAPGDSSDSGRAAGCGAGQSMPNLELAILQRTGDPHSIKLVLDVRQEWLEEAPSPLALVGITLEAVFSADKSLSVEQVNQSLPLMGVVNLYGQARAIVAQFTALTPAGPYWLPLVDMQAWFEKWIAAQAAKLGEAEATKSKEKKKGKE